jgi:hypothetical protein
MGGRLYGCTACGATTPLYNSCGDRHCPQCQGEQRAAWFAARQAELLPVEYFHVVFTVPDELNPLAAAHPKCFYNLLFQAVRETLLEVAATPRHLGARIGGQMVLHTWGQTLQLHPHVHVILPGGGLTDDGHWKACPPGFFLPVKVLSRVFRGKLLALLRHAHESDGLRWTGGLSHLTQPGAFVAFLQPLYEAEWNVYAKPPTGSAEQVLKYLARYTHRVAISNRRIESLTADGQVTFTYKDYAHGSRVQRMTLPADEFLRRFSQHVLPRGFVRLRGFGLLANCARERNLARCREALGIAGGAADSPDAAGELPAGREHAPATASETQPRCRHCGQARLRPMASLSRPTVPELVARTYPHAPLDSS